LPDKVRIGALTAREEFDKLIPIQRAVWRHADLDLTPVHQFCVSSRMGGIILGAFVGHVLAGFVYSFPAVFGKRPCQHSHLLAVLPEYQGRGLGKRLKWAQREETLRRGYDLLTWTFDPLQTRNANLNLQTLGAVSRTYLFNFYGLTPALCLGPGVPTDRLLVEWPIRERRVGALAARKAKAPMIDVERVSKVLERRTKEAGPFPRPSRPKLDLRDDSLLAEVPRDIRTMKDRPGLVSEWQSCLRRAMTGYFERGYRVGSFIYGERCFFVLKKDHKTASRNRGGRD
jgi:predicted GNAT superfamily acetyltransferase